MASISSQIRVESDRIILERITNRNGVSYDLTLRFKANGMDIAPPPGPLQRAKIYEEIQGIVEKILTSVPGIDAIPLEKVGFLVEEDPANSRKAKTAILITQAARPILDAWRDGNWDTIEKKEDTRLMLLSSSGSFSEGKLNPDGTAKPDSVHRELKTMRSLFRSDTILVPPKKRVSPASASSPLLLPDMAAYFSGSHPQPVSAIDFDSPSPPTALPLPPPLHPLPPPPVQPTTTRTAPQYPCLYALGKDHPKFTAIEKAWEAFIRKHADYQNISHWQLLGREPLGDGEKYDRLRQLFENDWLKQSLYDQFPVNDLVDKASWNRKTPNELFNSQFWNLLVDYWNN